MIEIYGNIKGPDSQFNRSKTNKSKNFGSTTSIGAHSGKVNPRPLRKGKSEKKKENGESSKDLDSLMSTKNKENGESSKKIKLENTNNPSSKGFDSINEDNSTTQSPPKSPPKSQAKSIKQDKSMKRKSLAKSIKTSSKYLVDENGNRILHILLAADDDNDIEKREDDGVLPPKQIKRMVWTERILWCIIILLYSFYMDNDNIIIYSMFNNNVWFISL